MEGADTFNVRLVLFVDAYIKSCEADLIAEILALGFHTFYVAADAIDLLLDGQDVGDLARAAAQDIREPLFGVAGIGEAGFEIYHLPADFLACLLLGFDPAELADFTHGGVELPGGDAQRGLQGLAGIGWRPDMEGADVASMALENIFERGARPGEIGRGQEDLRRADDEGFPGDRILGCGWLWRQRRGQRNWFEDSQRSIRTTLLPLLTTLLLRNRAVPASRALRVRTFGVADDEAERTPRAAGTRPPVRRSRAHSASRQAETFPAGARNLRPVPRAEPGSSICHSKSLRETSCISAAASWQSRQCERWSPATDARCGGNSPSR